MENQIEPSIFWCSCCGKNIWIIATSRTRPEDLICDDCAKFFNQYDGGTNNDTNKETKNNV